jgi:hypothetical protein
MAGSGLMRPCAAATGPYQEEVHNFVYLSTYISIHLKNNCKTRPNTCYIHICYFLDICTYTLDLGPMLLTWPKTPPNIDPALPSNWQPSNQRPKFWP